MLNVFNELYLHDQSRKVTIGYYSRGMSGKPLMSTPLFGYVKDPQDKEHWLIEPEAAETVRRMFALAAEGKNPNEIARVLRDEGFLTPAAYFAKRGQNNRCNHLKKETGPCEWRPLAVRSLLPAQEYLGHTVNFRSAKRSYKSKRKDNPPEKQVIFPNTHEAIIDQEIWDKAQLVLHKGQPRRTYPPHPLKGLFICGCCGKPMILKRDKPLLDSGEQRIYFECATHQNSKHKSVPDCVPNSCTLRQLRPLLQEAIRKAGQLAIQDEALFLQKLREVANDQPKETRQLKKSIAAKERRIA